MTITRDGYFAFRIQNQTERHYHEDSLIMASED